MNFSRCPHAGFGKERESPGDVFVAYPNAPGAAVTGKSRLFADGRGNATASQNRACFLCIGDRWNNDARIHPFLNPFRGKGSP